MFIHCKFRRVLVQVLTLEVHYCGMYFYRWTVSAELRREQLKVCAVLPEYLIISRYLLLLSLMKWHEVFLEDWCELCVVALCEVLSCLVPVTIPATYRRVTADLGMKWGGYIPYSVSVSVGHLAVKNLRLVISCKRILFSAQQIVHIHVSPFVSMEQRIKEQRAVAAQVHTWVLMKQWLIFL
jgi:hypothetical protein